MNKIKQIRIAGEIFSGILLLSTLFSGCSRKTNEIAHDNPPAQTIPVHSRKPERIGILQDMSISVDSESRIDTTLLRKVANYLTEVGGELFFGVIIEYSDYPLNRIFITPKPQFREKLEENKNPFFQNDLRKKFEEQKTKFSSVEKAWADTTLPQINSYLLSATKMLERERAKATDINSAINRAALFFNEPTAGETPIQRLIILSDLQHNTWQKLSGQRPDSSVQIILVNGVIEQQKKEQFSIDHQFENATAAIHFITNQ